MVGGESTRAPAVWLQTGLPSAAFSACTVCASTAATKSLPPATVTLLSRPPTLASHVLLSSAGTAVSVAPLRVPSCRYVGHSPPLPTADC